MTTTILRKMALPAFLNVFFHAAVLYKFAGNTSGRFAASAVQGNGFHGDQSDVKPYSCRYGLSLLLFFALLLGMAFPAHAIQIPCSSLPGNTLDGDIDPIPPANIKIDINCRIQNYPGGLNTNFSFDNNDPTPYLVIFDNVFFTGQMSCNTVANHKIWFTNGSTTNLSASCQNILIPVEKIDKQNPAGQTTATIGVPFTYMMTIPVLFDPATGGIVTDGSVNPVGNIHVTDDLTLAATGAELTLLNVIAYEEGTNIPVPVNNIGGNNLDFTLPDIAAGDQIIVEVTVVLNDTPANVAGNTFINTAKWEFSRFIDGQFFSPLPGEWGITLPLTIAEPDLVVTKTNPDTVLNIGDLSTFTIDVQNNGGSDAWNVTVFDQFPDTATAGMCNFDPVVAGITAQIFEADGTTPVSGVMVQGSDFLATYRDATANPPSSRCQLSITMLDPVTVSTTTIGPTQRLIVSYQSQLDSEPLDLTGDGVALTNVAGAIEWFGADSSIVDRRVYTESISDGTPLTVDHEDSHTIITSLSGYVFHKTVENLNTGANPTATAAPGDTLRYRLRLFNVDQNFTGITIVDQLDDIYFDLSSFNMVAMPANAEFVYTAGGLLTIDGIGAADLDLPVGSEIVIEFDITLDGAPPLVNGDQVLNQASLTSVSVNALSDDPAGGIVPAGDPGEPTLVVIQSPGVPLKVNTQATATIGEQFTYTITVPETSVLVPLYDVRILDDLVASSADISFVSANVVSGGNWTLSNIGTASNVIIEDSTIGIDIPAGGQAVIEITVELLNTVANNSVPPTLFNNTASYTYNRTNGVNATQTSGGADTTDTDMSVVEPALINVSKVGTLISAAPVSGGSIIEYVISMTNGGDSTAYNVNVVDNLPAELALFAGFTPTISGIPDTGFDPVPIAGLLPGQLIWGRLNGDGTLDIPVGQTLVLTYQAQVQTSTAATFNNEVWINWLSLETGSASARTGVGCPTITAPNDYCVTATSTALTIIDSTRLSKAVIADSWITDGSTAIDAAVRVGDTATYQLTLDLGEGTTSSLTVSDALPAGMVYENLVSITPTSGVGDFIYTVTSQPAVGDSGTLIWDFGDVVNTPSNDATPVDTLVIEYTARVIENDVSTIAQTPSTILTNTATLAYVDSVGSPVIDPARLESQASITVLQAVLSTVTKTENGLANTVATPLNVNVATDIMQFQLESCNTAAPAAPAYSILLSDLLATHLDETSLTVPVVTVNGAVLTAVTDYIYTPPAARGGTMQIELLVPVNPDECVTVDYDIGIHTDFPPAQTWNNSVTVDEYWSLPAGSGQQYSPLGPAQFFMTNIAGAAPLTKTVTSPVSGEITIGEEVVYTIVVPATPFNAELRNVVITDPLFSALTYSNATAVGNSSAMVVNIAGQNVTLSFAQIPANEQVTITLSTRLDNNAAANAGVSFTNTATYTSTDLPAPVVGISGVLNIVEPDITIDKSVSPTVPPNPGDTLTYSVTFTAGSGANFSDAFDLSITDTLSAGLSYVPGTARVDTVLINNPTGGTGPILTWDLSNADIDVPEGATVVLTYDVLVDALVVPGQVLSNSAIARWTSLNGNLGDPLLDPDERNGTDGIGGLNDYETVTAATSLISQSGALLKEVLPNTRTEVSVGEQFSYRITVPATPQSTPLNDVRILDDLTLSTLDTVDMSFVSASVFSGGSWTLTNTGTATSLIIEDTSTGIDIPAGGQAVIDITVMLNNSAINTSGKIFNNTADYTYGVTQLPGRPDTSGDLTIIGPDTVTLEKSGPATMSVGTPETFTLNVQNTGTAPAWDLTITDNLPNLGTGGMCDTAPTILNAQIFQADGVTAVSPVLQQGTDYISNFSGAPACSLTITMQSAVAAINATDRLIVNYQASLDIDNIGGTILTNVAAATEWFGDDTAGAGATGSIRTYTGSLTDGTIATLDEQDAHSLTVESPVLIFRKTVVNTTTGQDPGANAQPGETLRYTLYVENISPTPIANFSLLDDLDALNSPAIFVPGSLNIISAPVGADTSNTNINGGINGTGLLDVRNLSIDADGGANDIVQIVFEVTLVAVIDSNTVVLNQAQISAFGQLLGDSDDPNVNGFDNPNVSGDEDPTETLITSSPVFLVQKTSLDITGNAADLQAGDTLRYTITVTNIGPEDAVNVLISDQIPVNTTYVANSSTLNGVAVADAGAGISALNAGLLINAPANTTPGFMLADSGVPANNVATITFDVVVNAAAVAGTVISNQGFISGDGAGSGIFAQQPSDDPATAAVDDPTIDVVGNVALFDVQKTVAIVIDGGALGVVDPNDVLRYTITSTNLGAVPVTNVVLTDAVPVSTTYVSNSTLLNNLAIADPAANVSPLIAGIDISSSDLTPPLPLAGAGTLSPGQSSVVTFNVVVDAGTLAGTTISNQGFVSNNELPTEPTDFDGIDSNGDQPTEVIVGQAPQIIITKTVTVVGGGAVLAGGELEYVIRVTNTGVVPVSNVVITDNLDLPIAAQMTYVANSGLLNGLPTGISIAGSILTADYSTTYGDLAADGIVELRFRVLLANTLIVGDTVTNTGIVDWNATASASATVSIDVGGIPPGTANLNGEVWHDSNFNNTVDVGEDLLQGWTVQLYSNNVLLASVLTDNNGVFQFSGLAPSLPTPLYELRYLAPGAVATTATLGNANSVFTNAPHRITDIDAPSGANVVGLNLPIQPNGVVYNSLVRVPVAGVRLTMINQTRGNQPVPASCYEDIAQADQITLADGFYKFDLNFSDALRCAEGDEYEIQVQPPSNGFIGTTSVIIAPVVPVTGIAQNVINCPGDLVPATANHCENSVSAALPSTLATDNYYLKFLFNNTPVRDQIFNNHIPVDPDLGGAVAISKIAGLQNVTRSQLVPYTITVTNTFSVPLDNLIIVDNFPAGFKYVTESSRVDKAEVEPTINDRRLTWDIQSLAVGESREIKLLLIVGSGVGEGEYVNTAQMINTLTNAPASGVASATVRVIPDPTFDCTDIIGKVFDDKNMNAYQDKGETGLPGVQVATARGLRVTTDQHGRFHITCAVVPHEVRGSNFIMKLDDRTLPSGYRVTSENPRVQRATRGKMMKFNFGAVIHRVVRLDLADGVFEKGSTELRPQWRSRIEMLLIELQKDASILRLSYLGENETEAEVADRLDAIETLISDRWEEINCCYKLTIETEVFWRKGNPSDRKGFE